MTESSKRKFSFLAETQPIKKARKEVDNLSSEDDIQIIHDSSFKKEPSVSSGDEIEVIYDSLNIGEEPIQNGNVKSDSDSSLSNIDMSAINNDIEVNGITLDDEGELAPTEDEMNINEVHAVDIAIEHEKIVNGGAYPHFTWSYVEEIITKLKRSPCYQKANEQILHHYGANIQDDRTLTWKDNARHNLELACQTVFPSARLFAVGSTMNGCGSFNSDMDICVVIDPSEMAHIADPRRSICHTLSKIKTAIQNIPVVARVFLIRAVVPILQVRLKGTHSVGLELEVDINVNNIAGIYNTHLIHHYSRVDERFPALCLLIKHWAFNAGINSAQDGTFNSYSLILLVLHYMQCGCQPPIIPNLQEICPDVFNGQVPVENLRFFDDETTFDSQNTSNFIDLLIGFFTYYAAFDFDKYAISIRRARVFHKNLLPNETRQKYTIFIEEPFDHNNTARCVRPCGYEKIKQTIKSAYNLWKIYKKPSLSKMGIIMPPKHKR